MPWEVSVRSIGSAAVTIQAPTFFIGSQKGKNVLPDYFRSSSVIGCLYSADASFPPAAIGPDVVLEGRALCVHFLLIGFFSEAIRLGNRSGVRLGIHGRRLARLRSSALRGTRA